MKNKQRIFTLKRIKIKNKKRKNSILSTSLWSISQMFIQDSNHRSFSVHPRFSWYPVSRMTVECYEWSDTDSLHYPEPCLVTSQILVVIWVNGDATLCIIHQLNDREGISIKLHRIYERTVQLTTYGNNNRIHKLQKEWFLSY